jgi:hypothetical protein
MKEAFIINNKEYSRILKSFCSFMYADITIYLIHPGVVSTNFFGAKSDISKFFVNTIMKLIGISAEQGATNVLYPVLSSENKETGNYYHEGIEREPNKIANDREVAKKLWDVSEQILRDRGMI